MKKCVHSGGSTCTWLISIIIKTFNKPISSFANTQVLRMSKILLTTSILQKIEKKIFINKY